MINFEPIGFVRSSYGKGKTGQLFKNEPGQFLEIKEEYIPALAHLDDFNYIFVLFYLHKIKKDDLKLQLDKGELMVGLFASRIPERPNPIGLSVVRLIRIQDNRVFISGIDAFEGTPILDIKPYIKELDVRENANSGWITVDNILEDKIYLYTDGACSGNPGPGGYAALIINRNNQREITGYEPETTNNRMELLAVIEGLKEIKKGSQVKLVSDSNYVLKGITEWVKDWKSNGWKTASNKPVKNRDLWMKLDKLIKDYQIEFVKVKGHAGDKYNELVDTLAREQIELNSGN